MPGNEEYLTVGGDVFRVAGECPWCHGRGKVVYQVDEDEWDTDICVDCYGTGKWIIKQIIGTDIMGDEVWIDDSH